MAFSFGTSNPSFPVGSAAANAVVAGLSTNNELPGARKIESTNSTVALVHAAPSNGVTLTDADGNIHVPDFVDIFPYHNLLIKVRDLYSKMSASGRDAKFAVQELLQITSSTVFLSNPPPPVFVAPDMSIRQRLQGNPHVSLRQNVAALTPQMLLEVFAISDALYISEQSALSIYAQVSQPEVRYYLGDSGKDSTLMHDIPAAASALFFQQRLALWKIILILTQSRLENKNVEATDVLLNSNLILNIVRTFRFINQLVLQEQSRINQCTLSSPGEAQPNGKDEYQWLHHLYQEQNMASQCLFYLAYSTQLTTDEVASLLDLIRDITNEALPVLDPILDVPDPYHYHHTVATPQWGPFTQSLPPPTDKTLWEWEDELVQTVWKKYEAPVLQYTSILVMSVISAMDTQQYLLDRQTHNFHSFGVGNSLFRSLEATGTFDSIKLIHERLDVSAAAHWKRQDIWGVLTASYAIAILPISSLLASPRATSSSSTIKRTWKACLTAPSDYKSFAFVRLSLLPALKNYGTKIDRCELTQFLISVLADFMSSYMDVVCTCNAIPFSRSKWEENETKRLAIAREDQERNRSFYQTYGGGYDEKDIPEQVDLMKRPDCIDDIVAVAIEICSQGPDYTLKFWASEEFIDNHGSKKSRFVPSRGLKTLEVLQDKDRSLTPIYVSLLAVLASVKPSIIFDLVNGKDPNFKVSFDWTTIFETLRWYVRQMSDGFSGEAASNSKFEDQYRPSNGYYYGSEDDNLMEDAASNLTTLNPKTSNSRLDELREVNMSIVLSHLALITKVATNYATGRVFLVNMNLSIQGNQRDEEGDSVLIVLFSLAIAPLTPRVRGAVLATLAALLKIDGTNEEERILICKLARNAWDLLELSQIVPVFMLDQYQSKNTEGLTQTMTFPPSSLSLISSGALKSWLPADPKYGIIFEMEHIESRDGSYPATEGLLQLLTSLVSSIGCPSDLGEASEQLKPGRLRPGATAYIEYILYFVIPRATRSGMSTDPLPFKTNADFFRLLTLSFGVVQAVLSRYAIPTSFQCKGSQDLLNHEAKLRTNIEGLSTFPLLLNNLIKTASENETRYCALDFDKQQTLVSSVNNVAKSAASLPRVKSPGFTILADILSLVDTDLWSSILLVLSHSGGSEGIRSMCAKKDYEYGVTWALFVDTPPTLHSAKLKHNNGGSLVKQSLLRPLLPPLDVSLSNNWSMDVVHWRTQSVALSLQILVIAAAKEYEFIQAVGGVATTITALQFKPRINIVQRKEMNLTNVRNAIIHQVSPQRLPLVTQYIALSSADDAIDSEISSLSLALLCYSMTGVSNAALLTALNLQSENGRLKFVSCLAERLMISSKRTQCSLDACIVRTLLYLMNSDLSHVLLGLPTTSIHGFEQMRLLSAPHHNRHLDCFTVLLDRLADDDFLTGPSSAEFAAAGFRIIFKLVSTFEHHPLSKKKAEHLALRMKARDFFDVTALQLFARRESGPSLLEAVACNGECRLSHESMNLMHGASWFLKALAAHFLYLTQVFGGDSLSSSNQRLLNHLLDKEYHLIVNAINCVPLACESKNLSFPRLLLPLQSVVESCLYPIDNGGTSRYMILDVKALSTNMKNIPSSDDGLVSIALAWAEDWNSYVRREYTGYFLSFSISLLIEATLDFSHRTVESGILCSVETSQELRLKQDFSILFLLDQMTEKLFFDVDKEVGCMSDHLMRSVSICLCNEVLLLIDRMLGKRIESSYLTNFIDRIGIATLSSLKMSQTGVALTLEDEERSILLGFSFIKLCEAANLEFSDNTRKLICTVAASFAELSSRSIMKSKTGPEAKLTMTFRSIFSSLMIMLDNEETTPVNPVLISLKFTGVFKEEKKSPISGILHCLSELDKNACFLVEKIACVKGGANLLLEVGIMNTLDATIAALGQLEPSEDINLIDNEKISFLTQLYSLFRTILASESLSRNQTEVLREKVRDTVLSFSAIFIPLCEAFPSYGDVWLEFVQTLAFALKRQEINQWDSFLRKSQTSQYGEPALPVNSSSLISCMIKLTLHLMEHPFPDRFQRNLLPHRLRSEVVQHNWWDAVEHEHHLKPFEGDIELRNPPTESRSAWSNKTIGVVEKAWTLRKYEACLAAGRVIDASLTVIFELAREGVAVARKIDFSSLARGLCRLSDSLQGITKRLTESTSFLDTSLWKDITVEKKCLEDISLVHGQCCEKLLLLFEILFDLHTEFHDDSPAMSKHVLEFNPKAYAEITQIVLQYTNIENSGISVGSSEQSDFSIKVARRLQEKALKIVNS